MLDTRFPRPVGDIGNPASFCAAVRLRVVEGALPRRVVASADALHNAGLLPAFAAAARELQDAGAQAITTSCGFLVLWQRELQAAVRVPLVSSSMLQLPALLRGEPEVGVLTIDAARLGPEHLRAGGVPQAQLQRVLVQGMPADGAFVRAIMGNQPSLDLAAAQAEAVAAALALQARSSKLRTLVLECTNLPPYASAIREATGWRVLSLRDDPQLARFFAP